MPPLREYRYQNTQPNEYEQGLQDVDSNLALLQLVQLQSSKHCHGLRDEAHSRRQQGVSATQTGREVSKGQNVYIKATRPHGGY